MSISENAYKALIDANFDYREEITALRARVVELTSDKQHLRDCVERLCRGWARDRFLQREEASEAQVQDYVDRHWRLLVPAAYAQLV